VFTQHEDGSSILNSSFLLYSTSGLYPGNDMLNSDAVKDLLKYGSNLEIANKIIGTYVNDNQCTEIGKIIHDKYTEMINTGNKTQ
jgi:hypothetical protein